MSSTDVYETALKMVERYGFGLALATAVLWFVRVDVVIPMVEAHQQFLRDMTQTQKEITTAVQEQTKLLWAMQPEHMRTSHSAE
jgi:hypothetical protein